MINRKVFSLLSSGALMLSSLTPALTVSAQDFQEESYSEERVLTDYLKEYDNETLLFEIIQDVKLSINNTLLIIQGNLPSTYSLNLVNHELSEILISLNDKNFYYEIELDELKEKDYLLEVRDDNDEVILQLDMQETVYKYLEDETVAEDEEITENEESIENEEATENEELIENEVTTKNEELLEDKELVEDEDIIEEEEVIEDHELPVETELNTESTEDSLDEETVNSNEGQDEDSEIASKDETSDTIKEAVETDQEPVRKFALFSVATAPTRTADNGIYTVVSGDTFNDIARSFGLTIPQLREWNRHVGNVNLLKVGEKLAVTRTGVERMLPDHQKEILYKGGAVSPFKTNQEFIDAIAPLAIQIASQPGEPALWPSLMIAQAAHESAFGRSALGSTPYHNLSGIKGTYNGNSVLMWTWEVYSGNTVNVLANFRHYPSYTASLQDYANLLRYGLSWDRYYYSGTWRSNTNSVWDVLDNGGLRGYATDPNYFAAIRRTINNFDLTKYDTGNYYVRTGTFLGEQYTKLQMDKLMNENSNYSYSMVRDENKAPYSYRRIESTKEFLGEAGAQRVIDKLKNEKGWSASMVPTGNSTQRFRVWSGWFNSLPEAERAADQFSKVSNYAVIIVHGSDGKYRLRTGYFNGESSAEKGLKQMESLGWSARIRGSNDSTPHYKIRTGTFNTPNHVNSAEVYFQANGWGSKQVLTSKNNYYYRIVINGFPYMDLAQTYVNHLQKTYNWASTAFKVER